MSDGDRGSSTIPARYSTETFSNLATASAVRIEIPTRPCSMDDRWLADVSTALASSFCVHPRRFRAFSSRSSMIFIAVAPC